ncbi:hypothetical protein CO660_00080 [Rhizobium sp. L9]|uniref:hypothetical protein n=1 Tax=Rhizobium sp. L9 TaxID=1340738 RepID=UPI000BEDE762|nr:hypothetical protein [Rhizobium sp. L9]PDT32276.1 hypothetical protein CO660_00080 [Rhizobium sp. L9]
MVLVIAALLAPVFAGAVKSYGCISSITGDQVPLAARNAYLEKLTVTKRAGARDLNFVKCGVPDEVPAYFYGIAAGTEWKVFCAYIKNGSVLTSEEFSINRCKATRNWELVDEGFPKPAHGSGYDSLL